MFGFLILLFSCYLILFTQSVIQAHATVPSLQLKQVKLRIVAIHIFEHILHGRVLTVGAEPRRNVAGRKER